MAKAKRLGAKPKATKVAKRDKDGTFMGIRIADPPVKPRGVTVQQIRRAVETVMARRKRA
jgi:hypothetical protein